MRVATLARDKVREIWVDPGTLATPLLVMFLDQYGEDGTECLQWDPETIKAELEDDLRLQLPQASLDRLLAAILIVTTDRFYKNLPDFINICNLLSGDTLDPRIWDPADAIECAWGMTEAMLLSPPEEGEEEQPFAEEIAAYVGEVVKTEGIKNPPDVLRIGGVNTEAATNSWSDDPIMFNAIWDSENGRATDIRRTIRERLAALIQQLEELPLIHGDTSLIVEKLLKVIPSGTANG